MGLVCVSKCPIKESFDLGIIVVKGIIHLTLYASLSCINLLVRLKTHEKHRSHERKKNISHLVTDLMWILSHPQRRERVANRRKVSISTHHNFLFAIHA